MRAILNISVPSKLKKEVEQAVKNGGYVSNSEFIRDLLRLWKEDQLLKGVERSRKEIRAGKGKVLRSFRDLR